MRSLGADNQRRTVLGLVVAFAVLGAWGAWLFLARVTLYEVTTEARLEAEQASYTIEAATAGRVVNTRLAGLFKEGVIAEMEVLRVRSEARSRRAEVESLQHTVTKLERQQRTEET